MSEQAIKYLRENRGKYKPMELAEALRGAGYEKEDIEASMKEVFPEETATVSAPIPHANQSFGNFRDKKIYTDAVQKWADFLFGVFAPGILLLSFGVILDFFNSRLDLEDMWPLFVFAEIFLFFYFWNRRHLISWGILAQIIVYPVMISIFFDLFFHF
ncbi:MAG: hypothetical protein WC878_06920 [Candidatus Paceibacterota bacterium]|jgi:hypothetical protein